MITERETGLGSLAAGIRAEHDLVLKRNAEAVRHAIRAGDLLIEAKARVSHGEWLPWLATNLPGISDRTAQRYMKLARHREDASRVADLGVAGADQAIREERDGYERVPRRPRAEVRSEHLAEVLGKIGRDAARGEGRTAELIAAFDGPREDVIRGLRILWMIAQDSEAEQTEVLCPVCSTPHAGFGHAHTG